MSTEAKAKFNLMSFRGKFRILHMTWVAFFISFLVWFNHAPLMASLRESFGLSDQEVTALLIMNVALTIPARIIIAMLVDRFGPVAGMVGAYGNVGAVTFLTVLSFVSAQAFFMVIAGAAIVTLIATHFLLDEPDGQTAEILPDGAVQLIDVT